MAEDFPKPSDEKFVPSDESLDDDDDEEDEPKEKTEKKSSRGIFEAWLKGEKTKDSEKDSKAEEADEKPQNALQKLGSIFFDSEGREVEASEEVSTVEAADAEQSEELSNEDYETNSELSETENIVEGAPEISETPASEAEPENDSE
nr:hypothetical protein [bacterium]